MKVTTPFGHLMTPLWLVLASAVASNPIFASQKVWLDFNNESGATGGDEGDEQGTKGPFVDSPIVRSWIRPTDPRFDTPEEVAAVMMDLIKMQVEDDFRGFWVSFSQTDPDPDNGRRSIIDFPSGIRIPNPFSEEDALGLAEKVDLGNRDPTDNAWIAVDNYTSDEDVDTFGEVVNELANGASHELAHLLGIRHKDGTKDSLMNGFYDGVDKSFSLKSKLKLANNVGLDVFGFHVNPQALVDALTGWVAEYDSLEMQYHPSGGRFGNGWIQLTGNLSENLSSGGTVMPTGGLGLHGETFGIDDPQGQFVIEWPNQLDFLDALPGGEMRVAPFQVRLWNPELQEELMLLDVVNAVFLPDAVVRRLEGNDGPEFEPTLEEPFPVPDVAVPLAGLRGDATVSLTAEGGYLDDVAAVLSAGGRGELVILTDLDTLFAQTPTTGTAALRVVPEPLTVTEMATGVFLLSVIARRRNKRRRNGRVAL